MRKFLPILFLILPAGAFGQTPFVWDFGAALGITSYQGDLDALKVNAGFREINYAASVYLRRNISNHFATRLNLLAGKVAGDDNNFAEPEWRVRRGISFESPLIELAAMGEFYPFGMYPKGGKASKGRRALSPYLLLGLGGVYSNSKVNWNDTNGNDEINPALAQQDKDKKGGKIHMVLPVGLGFRMKLKDHSTFSVEAALRPTFSDYLDGVSQAGNPNEEDWYFTAQIGISYPFGKYKPKPQNKHIVKRDPEKPLKQKKTIISDLDKDGTGDLEDECVDIPGPKHLKGCPDKDGDGVPDIKDVCSEQPGLVELNGCPDGDGDGIADKDDKCPDVRGTAEYRGCPPSDRDQDGVGDVEDRCPDLAGEIKWSGCPDSDGDNTPDDKDACPDAAGLEKLAGCPDSDSDGIADKDDKCPNTAGTAALNGCPNLPPPDKAVYFRTSLDTWYRTSDETLDEVVEILQKDPSLKARIEGHTDESTEKTATADLSERRSKKIYDYLMSKGIAPDRLHFEGLGSGRPAKADLRSHDPLLNQQLNRRVEVRFSRE